VRKPKYSAMRVYQGVEKREETQDVKANWHVAMRPGKRRSLDKDTPMGKLRDEIERTKARIRAKVEHPFAARNRWDHHGDLQSIDV
jgi:IS5 family transposase